MLIDLMGKKGSTNLSLPAKIKTGLVTAVKTRGHWSTLQEAYKVNKLATALKDVYDEYPTAPAAFEDWKATRDEVLDDVYAVTGADPKY
jgi:digeranylgeranylglycerophospholipid reductase